MPGFLYLAQPDSMPIYKLGVTSYDPDRRRDILQGQSPHVIRFIRVLAVNSIERARAFERHIQSWTQRAAAYGEWFTDLDVIQMQMDEVAPAVDVTHEYVTLRPIRPKPRTPISLERLDFEIAIADLRERGIHPFEVFGSAALSPARQPKDWRAKYATAVHSVPSSGSAPLAGAS